MATIDGETVLQAVCLGFALAGVIATTFELLASRRAELSLLRSGHAGALAVVPLLVLCGPFIILRAVLAAPHRRTIPAVGLAVLIAPGLEFDAGLAGARCDDRDAWRLTRAYAERLGLDGDRKDGKACLIVFPGAHK